MPVRFAVPLRSPASRGRWLRVALLFFFAWLAGRYWHPYYGFTQFLQVDAQVETSLVPALRGAPILIYAGDASYDGAYYAQIATNPALDPAILKPAIDDAGYRARRILLGAVAWVLGGGEPVRVVQVYSGLNVVLWFALAAVLWRVFPVATARGNAAWTAVLFGAGVLFSVRFALTDLAALLLTAGAVVLAERGRALPAAGLVGLAGLTRETALLGLAALWNRTAEVLRFRGRTVLLLAAALLPLALWLLYIQLTLGGSSAGQRNLTWPLAGWLMRWVEFTRGAAATGNPWLVLESVLEHAALTVQAVYLLRNPERECPWWRVGAAYLLLFVVLGHAVWGGFPNAASRVLLPLTLAFNVRAVRAGARWTWLVLGNLSVVAGLHTMLLQPGAPHQLPMPGSWETRYSLETDARWSMAEWHSHYRWAWCAGEGGLKVRTWPPLSEVRLELEMRGVTPRDLQVLHQGRVVWSGRIGDRPAWITLPVLPVERGQLKLELRSPEGGADDGADNTARTISFACFGARVAE